MSLKRTTLIIAAAALVVSAGTVAIAQQASEHGDTKLLSEAKLSVDAARQIALRTQTGTVKEWEIEREPGGSGLRYSFDIESGGQIHEVGVDARDGKVLENAIDTNAAKSADDEEDGEEDDDK